MEKNQYENEFYCGFQPVFDANSKILILGSFPSVKSRQVNFYYGNKQNRFWKMLSDIFKQQIPATIEGKKEFLSDKKIALWDIVGRCTVVNSSDAKIANISVVDIIGLLNKTRIEKILCNGAKSYLLLKKHFPSLLFMAQKMPSTSPANVRSFDFDRWAVALRFLL
jgi:TDG/mug DNA glycosylase family protein